MDIVFSDEAWSDYLFWQKHDKKVLRKINTLIKDTTRTPFEGMGSPEPLRHDLTGYWSRRITLEHRLVYRELNDQIRIVQCRFHY
jgi:toxin YoeB